MFPKPDAPQGRPDLGGPYGHLTASPEDFQEARQRVQVLENNWQGGAPEVAAVLRGVLEKARSPQERALILNAAYPIISLIGQYAHSFSAAELKAFYGLGESLDTNSLAHFSDAVADSAGPAEGDPLKAEAIRRAIEAGAGTRGFIVAGLLRNNGTQDDFFGPVGEAVKALRERVLEAERRWGKKSPQYSAAVGRYRTTFAGLDLVRKNRLLVMQSVDSVVFIRVDALGRKLVREGELAAHFESTGAFPLKAVLD